MTRILLDGSMHEGGGQMLRTALALSLLTNRPFEIDKIRKGRPAPGLKSQHLHCIKALRQIANFDVTGDEIGSEKLTFVPGKIFGGNIDVDIETAGSVTLLLQSVMLPAIFAERPTTIRIRGGTDAKFAQPYDYFSEVFLPDIQAFAKIEARLIRRGYYPKGQGVIDMKITPKFKLSQSPNFDYFRNMLSSNILPIDIVSRGKLLSVRGRSHASSDLESSKVSERQAESARKALKKLNAPISIDCSYQDTASTGSGMVLWAIFSDCESDECDSHKLIRIGGDSLGERAKKAEDVGTEAASNLLKEIESGAPIDSYKADQLLPFIALLKGSNVKVNKITDHCLSNIYTIESFLGKVFETSEKNISVR